MYTWQWIDAGFIRFYRKLGEHQTNTMVYWRRLAVKHTTPLPNPGVSSQKWPLVAGVLDAFQGSAQVLWVTDVWNRKRTLRCAYRNLGGSSFAIYYEGFLDTPSSKSFPSKHQLNVGKVQTVSNHQWDVLCFVLKCPQTNCLERFPSTANRHKRRCLRSPDFDFSLPNHQTACKEGTFHGRIAKRTAIVIRWTSDRHKND